MSIEAKVVADTINPHNGIRLTSLQLKYHRYIHGEFMTHRVFSRNASSSRAIPVNKMLSQVWSDPAIPLKFAANIPGMQAGAELTGWKRWAAEKLWRGAGKAACIFAWGMMKVGLHKQWANRVLEPWQYIHVIVTATDWDNFFELRNHKDAQPEIKRLAEQMYIAIQTSTPKKAHWHLPYITRDEFKLSNVDYEYSMDRLVKYSAARCARVSYLTHDGKRPDIWKDLDLYNKLVGSKPIHASPTEHQAKAVKGDTYIKNFRGWRQHRCDVEDNLKGQK